MNESLNSDSDIIVATMLCPYCETEIGNAETVCSRCGNRSADSAESSINPFKSPTAQNIQRITKSAGTVVSVLLTVGLLGLLFIVGLDSPGVAILLAVLTIPPWIRTALVMARRSRTGLGTSTAASATMYFGSVFITWLILFVSLISCSLTFCLSFVGAISISNDDQVALQLAGIAALVAFVVIVVAFTPWIRHRWIKHTSKK